MSKMKSTVNWKARSSRLTMRWLNFVAARPRHEDLEASSLLRNVRVLDVSAKGAIRRAGNGISKVSSELFGRLDKRE